MYEKMREDKMGKRNTRKCLCVFICVSMKCIVCANEHVKVCVKVKLSADLKDGLASTRCNERDFARGNLFMA